MIRTNSPGRGPRPRRRRGKHGPKRRNPALRDREVAEDIDLMIDRRDPAERPDSRFNVLGVSRSFYEIIRVYLPHSLRFHEFLQVSTRFHEFS